MQVHTKYLRAFYGVSYLIAKSKNPFTVGEEFVDPAAVEIGKIFLVLLMPVKLKKSLCPMTL